MRNIHDENRGYRILLPLVNWMFRHSYRHLKYVGEENIPQDGAIIFAPNHTNALQDALAVLSINSERKVFVARADIFRKPLFAKILGFLKIMPIRRMRDGASEVLKNDETVERAIDTLGEGVPFCILPEGTHRTKHSLLPLGKGIFRITLRANEKFGKEKPIYIVPVGLEYSDWFHLWDTLIINIGKPINMTEFIAQHADLEQPKLILAMREELTNRMREQIMWVPDDENYEKNWEELRKNPPRKFNWFPKHRMPKWLLLLMLIVLSPLFVLSGIITLPLWVAWLIIRWAIKDPAFHNSVQFVWQLIIIPLTGFIALPFWAFFQEYLYLARKFQKPEETK
ncbi:MAG: 1-acyl-sn-glycerol-3-phosphate acyltransferase [Paludibacteraceae bacterium]|nr:1-acyl-sn-glycerol-3-phosphate acyltransferase [Paludibacteraceae bacterium]